MGVRVPQDAKIIGANLRALRKAAGLSQKYIALLLGVTHQQIQKYEQGANRFPVEKLYRLRQFYDVPYDMFFKGVAGAQYEEADYSDVGYLKNFNALNDLQDIALRQTIYKVLMIIMRECQSRDRF